MLDERRIKALTELESSDSSGFFLARARWRRRRGQPTTTKHFGGALTDAAALHFWVRGVRHRPSFVLNNGLREEALSRLPLLEPREPELALALSEALEASDPRGWVWEPTPVLAAQLSAYNLGHLCGWGGVLVRPRATIQELDQAWRAWAHLEETCGSSPGVSSWPADAEGRMVWTTCTGRTTYEVNEESLTVVTRGGYGEDTVDHWRLEWTLGEGCRIEALSSEACQETAYRLINLDASLRGHLSRIMGRQHRESFLGWWEWALGQRGVATQRLRYCWEASHYQDGWE